MRTLTPDILAALRDTDSPTIANAVEAFDVRPPTEGYLSHRIRCLFPDMGVLTGYAVTATIDTTSPLDSKPAPNRWELYEQLLAAPKPAVVVLQAIGPNLDYSCVCGGGMATLMQRLGAVGLVTNGGVRDLSDLRALGFHCFSPGPVVAHGTIGIVDVNRPVSIDGVTVNPGDLLHGDENGLLVVPDVDAESLLRAAKDLQEAEHLMIARLSDNDFSFDSYRSWRESRR